MLLTNLVMANFHSPDSSTLINKEGEAYYVDSRGWLWHHSDRKRYWANAFLLCHMGVKTVIFL